MQYTFSPVPKKWNTENDFPVGKILNSKNLSKYQFEDDNKFFEISTGKKSG